MLRWTTQVDLPQKQVMQKRIMRAIERANQGWLNSVGYLVAMTAKKSIKSSRRTSRPGSPPTTKRGALRRAIRYRVTSDREAVLIGPTYSKVGEVGAAHEYGGKYKGQIYPERPFMGPALDEVLPQLSRRYNIS